MPRSKSRTATTAARRRRSIASRPRKQRGGSRTVLPISYFGGDDSAAYTGKCGRSPIQTAYGGSLPTSFGELGTSLGADFAGPNLAPGSGVDGVSASALQTGGARRHRKSARRKSTRRQPTRRSRARRAHRSRRTRTQRGGGGQYGRTVMPINYYGGDDSKAYGAPCGRSSFDTSYGRSLPTSFGGSAPELAGGFRGPNLAPGGMGDAFAVTGIQTGGGRRPRRGVGNYIWSTIGALLLVSMIGAGVQSHLAIRRVNRFVEKEKDINAIIKYYNEFQARGGRIITDDDEKFIKASIPKIKTFIKDIKKQISSLRKGNKSPDAIQKLEAQVEFLEELKATFILLSGDEDEILSM